MPLYVRLAAGSFLLCGLGTCAAMVSWPTGTGNSRGEIPVIKQENIHSDFLLGRAGDVTTECCFFSTPSKLDAIMAVSHRSNNPTWNTVCLYPETLLLLGKNVIFSHSAYKASLVS